MTIEQLDKIDFIGHNENDCYTVLTISDHLEWDGKNEKLLTLQAKINNYLAFIESGQLYEEYSCSQGTEIRIHLHCMYEPNKEGLKFLSLISSVIEEAGFKFTWEVHHEI